MFLRTPDHLDSTNNVVEVIELQAQIDIEQPSSSRTQTAAEEKETNCMEIQNIELTPKAAANNRKEKRK